MNMIDGLSSVLAGVHYGPVSAGQPFGASYLGGRPKQVPHHCAVILIGLGHGRNVLARNNENMDRRLRLDIRKRVTLVILVNGFGRDASINDPAEKAAHGCT